MPHITTNHVIKYGNMNQLISKLPFYEDVRNLDGCIYSVGGSVRDYFLDRPSKDLDIVIQYVSIDTLIEILSKYGDVDLVGKSFGVLNFREFGQPIESKIDIALPRTERKAVTGDGHKDFEIFSNPQLSIAEDLYRRDFTINSMAMLIEKSESCHTIIIDPYGGLADINSKTIRATNPESFSDDPLRMLRAVQFASRFGFSIEKQTQKMIKRTATKIHNIPGERIVEEFQKIVDKGSVPIAIKYLKKTNLFEELFGCEFTKPTGILPNNIQTVGEFVYYCMKCNYADVDKFWKIRLKGDAATEHYIKALLIQPKYFVAEDHVETKLTIFDMIKKAPTILNSKILNYSVMQYLNDFKTKVYPNSYKDLAINGDDLKELGFVDQQIGIMQKLILIEIFRNQLKNERDEIFNFIALRMNE